MSLSIAAAVAVFIVVYIAISTELINKTVAALLGASVFLALHLVGQEEAFRAVDWNVVFLLVGMMIIVGIANRTGLFQYIAIRTAKVARGDPVRVLLLLSLVTAGLSALLDNVTTMLIIAPVSILIAVELGISPVPFLVSEAIASNVGGTATLIGDPPNIMIGSAAGLSFLDFLTHLAPGVLFILAVDILLFFLLFRGRVQASRERRARIMEFDESKSITDRPLMIKSLAVFALVLAGFLLHGALGLEVATVALAGATLLMLLSGGRETEQFFLTVEWGSIFFFIGLFILVGGLVELGVIGRVARTVLGLTGGRPRLTAVIVIWASGFISAIVDNIPYVATMIPLIRDIGAAASSAPLEPLWWSLSLGACLGGNATLIGASANVVSAGIAAKSGYTISFLEFTRYGLLVTLVNLAVSTAYILLFFL
jgi:Na+/H+ antiporter NhaD/arsenite permease-like protein